MKGSIFLLAIFLFGCVQQNSMQQVDGDDLEPHRPGYHFTPESGWMNDPNGMVYFEGEYHLFYQYYPYATVWGPMHWGHAVSKDLINWEHLPIALFPDENGMIFSGSAVIDWQNTTGFGSTENPPMVAIFTYHNMVGEKSGREDYQSQGIAYSLDKGRTWKMYEGNPVLPNQGIKDFRDPKVIWHAKSEKWIMTLAAKDRIQFFSSPNLIDWSFASDFGVGSNPGLGVWECPDLFPLKVEDSNEEKWVLIISHGVDAISPSGGSCTRYYIGEFDGKEFKIEDPRDQYNWIDFGKDNYAGVTWSDIPKEDGRRLFLGWMSNWLYAKLVPTKAYRSAMTIPRELLLRETEEGAKLYSVPAKELNSLRVNEKTIESMSLEGIHELAANSPDQSELELVFDLKSASSKAFGVQLSNDLGEYVRVAFDKASNMIIVDRSNSGKMNYLDSFRDLQYVPLTYQNDTMKWNVFFDKSSLELFVDEGRVSVTDTFFPNENFNKLSLFSFDGKVQLVSGKVFDLNQ